MKNIRMMGIKFSEGHKLYFYIFFRKENAWQYFLQKRHYLLWDKLILFWFACGAYFVGPTSSLVRAPMSVPYSTLTSAPPVMLVDLYVYFVLDMARFHLASARYSSSRLTESTCRCSQVSLSCANKNWLRCGNSALALTLTTGWILARHW